MQATQEARAGLTLAGEPRHNTTGPVSLGSRFVFVRFRLIAA